MVIKYLLGIVGLFLGMMISIILNLSEYSVGFFSCWGYFVTIYLYEEITRIKLKNKG